MKKMIGSILFLPLILSMCIDDSADNKGKNNNKDENNKKDRNPIIKLSDTVEQTIRIWEWYKFPKDEMGIPDEKGKIVQEVINELGKKISIVFIPIAHAEEANLNSAYEVELYNKKLADLEAQCRNSLFSKENSHIKNDVKIHYFMSDCLTEKGLSKNDLSYRKIYKHFNHSS